MSIAEEFSRIATHLRSSAPGQYVINGQFVEFRLYFPLVAMEIGICVVPDRTVDPTDVISDRQIALIAKTLQMTHGLPRIKELVLSDYLDCTRSDERDSEEDIDVIYALASAENLFVMDEGYIGWPTNQCLLHFAAPWDTEQGIGITIVEGEVVGLGDF